MISHCLHGFFSELAHIGPAIEKAVDIMTVVKLVHRHKKNKKLPIVHQFCLQITAFVVP